MGDGAARRGQRLAELRGQAARERARGGDGDLLAEQRAHGELGRVGMPGHAAAGSGADEWAEQRIVAQRRLDRVRVGVEAQDRPRGADVPLDVGGRRDLEEAPVGHAPPIHAADHLLDPRDRPPGEEVDQLAGVQRGVVDPASRPASLPRCTTMRYSTLTTPIGELMLTADDDGALTGVNLPNRHRDPAGWERDDELLADARRQLTEYFAGERTAFDLPLRPAGAPVPAARLGRAAADPLRRDDLLRRDRPRARPRRARPRSRAPSAPPTAATRSRSSCRATA